MEKANPRGYRPRHMGPFGDLRFGPFTSDIVKNYLHYHKKG